MRTVCLHAHSPTCLRTDLLLFTFAGGLTGIVSHEGLLSLPSGAERSRKGRLTAKIGTETHAGVYGTERDTWFLAAVLLCVLFVRQTCATPRAAGLVPARQALRDALHIANSMPIAKSQLCTHDILIFGSGLQSSSWQATRPAPPPIFTTLFLLPISENELLSPFS